MDTHSYMSKMNSKSPGEDEVYDFLMDDSFVNYYFKRNAEDFNFWIEKLERQPELQSKVNEALGMLQMLTLTVPESEIREELQKLEYSISDLQVNKEIGTLNVLPDRARWSRRKKIAYFLVTASVLVIGVSIIMFRLLDKPGPLLSVINNNVKPIEFDLEDGTTVKLGPQSTLRYPGDFNEKDRKVYLEGEAVFHVKHDTQHPFKVFAGDLVATVLGTIFNVEKNPSDSSVYIELLKGSLKVDMNSNRTNELRSIYLNPNERVIYKRSTRVFLKEAWSPDTLKNNIINHLVFKNADFEMVSRKIKEIYGMTVVNQSKRKKWNYNAEFTNVGFKEVLDNICIVEGVKSDVTGDLVLLK